MSESTPIASVIVKYDYEAREEHECSIRKGERLKVLNSEHNWWKVSRTRARARGANDFKKCAFKVKNDRDQTFYAPSNHLQKLPLIDRVSETLGFGFGRSRSRVSQTKRVSVIFYEKKSAAFRIL